MEKGVREEREEEREVKESMHGWRREEKESDVRRGGTEVPGHVTFSLLSSMSWK